MAGRSLFLALLGKRCLLASTRLYSVSAPAVSVTDEKVQALLTQLTGLDLDKVFCARKEPLQPPTYKLLTLEQLEKAHAENVEEAKCMLQMLPLLDERPPRGEVIEKDENLSGAVKNRVIFTDTTHHKEDKDRWLVVREVDGTLREANWPERDRMCQLFFPKLGRKMKLPKMLQPHQLPEVLRLGHHILLLDVVCVQCAPDSKDYIRVHKAVYEDIEKRGLYEMLWSTRYFGCLVWHLITSDNVTGLFKHMIDKRRFEDAAGLVKLHLICYPESNLSRSLKGQPVPQAADTATDHDLIQAFCECFSLDHVIETTKQDIEQSNDKNVDRVHVEINNSVL